jgi:co-chaperonin GroES (HSP10)
VEANDLYGSQFNDTGITPTGYRILVEIPEPPKQKGLIHVPQQVQDKEKTAAVVAKVLQLGFYAYADEDRYPFGPWCKPGDYIAMSPYNGVSVRIPGETRDLRFINEDSVDGIVPDPTAIERA